MQINKLGDDLYLFIGDTYESNSSVFVAGDQVLLVDALASAQDAEALASVLVDQSTEAPVIAQVPPRAA